MLLKHHLHALGYALSDLRCSNVILVSFNQALVRPLGGISLPVRIRGKSLTMVYHVVEECPNILISYRDAVHATLTPHTTSGECSEPAIKALSMYRGEVIHLNVTDDATPKNFPPCEVPTAMESEVKAELKQMMDEGVIVEGSEPTEWCRPMIVQRKPNGLLRVCRDPRYLNAFLKQATYPLPDIESVFPKFCGAKFFSKLDLTAGFWQVRSEEQQSVHFLHTIRALQVPTPAIWNIAGSQSVSSYCCRGDSRSSRCYICTL